MFLFLSSPTPSPPQGLVSEAWEEEVSAETTSVSSLMGSKCHSSPHRSLNLRTPASPSIKGPLFYRPSASWGETCLRAGTHWHPKPRPQAFSLVAPAFSRVSFDPPQHP